MIHKSRLYVLDVVSDRLLKLRMARGLSQEELAAKSRVDNCQISTYECAVGLPSLTTLIRLCDALGTTPDVVCGYAPLHITEILSRERGGELSAEAVQAIERRKEDLQRGRS